MTPRTEIRRSRREQIVEFFRERLGQRIPSPELHGRFGSSFRTRVSEINRDLNAPITIRNQSRVCDGAEVSVYYAERRPPAAGAAREDGQLGFEMGRGER